MSPRGGCDCLLEVLDAKLEGSGSRYFRRCLFFPHRPMVGDEIYIDGDALKKAIVVVVDWLVHDHEAFMHVRLEATDLDGSDVEDLLEHGWVEEPDAFTPSPPPTDPVSIEPQDKGV